MDINPLLDPEYVPGEDLLAAIEKEEEGVVLPLSEPTTPEEYVAVQALPKEQRNLLEEAPEELQDDLTNEGHQPI